MSERTRTLEGTVVEARRHNVMIEGEISAFHVAADWVCWI